MEMEKTILIVDDSESIRQLVTSILKEAGYGVIAAVDGKDAAEKLSGVMVDMVVTDMNMPIMDGIELTRLLRNTSAHKFTPILMLTTESQQSKVLEGRAAGITGWIIKPFSPEKLIGVVKKLIK